MALFGSYAPPSVYTSVVIDDGGQPLFGAARIPVLIGEGLEYFTQNNVELHRGSSAVADDQVVNEVISDQLKPISVENHTYHTTYFPVVSGDGTGTVTNDVTKIRVTADGVPVTVVSLDGETGTFMVQELLDETAHLEVTYFFKQADQLVSLEDLSAQVPSFASLLLQTGFTVSVTVPGALGNSVNVTLTSTTGKSDLLAVSGAGTDDISVEIKKADNSTRNLTELKAILEAVQTKSAGYLVVTLDAANATDTAVAKVKTPLAGGNGPSDNKTFIVGSLPVVDGTNGGVVTTNVKNITILVNGKVATVKSLDGATGTFTLAEAVNYGDVLTATYYTNTFQNTSDMLPTENVGKVLQIGLGPDRADYVEGIDYVLSTDKNGNATINWGASYSLVTGTAKGTVELAAATTVKLVDEKVYLRPTVGVCNGINTKFTLEWTPVDGSGRAVTTNSPKLVQVYVGADAVSALEAGAQFPIVVNGDTKTITLLNPPQSNQKVFATYYRNTLADKVYTLTVANPNMPGQGTYKVSDELTNKLPVVTPSFNVDDVAFATAQTAGTVGLADLAAPFGATTESVTVTFDQTVTNTTPGTQASLTINGVTFTAQTPGVAGNSIQVEFDQLGTEGANVTGSVITIGGVHTASEVVGMFPKTVSGIVVNATGTGATQIPTTTATNLEGGLDAVTTTEVVGYSVAGTKSSGIGFFGQTYIDATSGLRFTLNVPAGWDYVTTDTLTLAVDANGSFVCGQDWNVALPGVQVKVASTLMTSPNDTAILSTYNKSGEEPNVGEFYYVSYTTPKDTQDMGLRLFTNVADAYAIYGQPSPTNRLSLAIQLANQNGAQQFGAIQVLKQPGLNTASDEDFIAAIQSLTKPLPGSDRKADVIVPVTSSMPVIQFLSRQLITQANVRNKGEAIGFVGFAANTDPVTARKYARSIKNARVVAIGNPLAGLTMTDPNTGLALEYAVSGEFLAAAMAGLSVNPANDVATTLTKQNLVGFSRLLVRHDEATMNLMAADGLTILTENNGALNIRHYKSTDPSNPITSEPTCTTVADYVRQQFRADLDQFIGRKLVDSLITDITAVCNARLRSLVSNEIITSYKNLSVTQDPSDPTTVNVTVSFKPMFSLLYISVTFTVTTTNA